MSDHVYADIGGRFDRGERRMMEAAVFDATEPRQNLFTSVTHVGFGWRPLTNLTSGNCAVLWCLIYLMSELRYEINEAL